jgi:hypothetical protein
VSRTLCESVESRLFIILDDESRVYELHSLAFLHHLTRSAISKRSRERKRERAAPNLDFAGGEARQLSAETVGLVS